MLALEGAFEEVVLSPEQKEFAQRAVLGFFEHQQELDALIEANIHGYSMDRIAAVDRNLLRLATYELMYEDAIPPAVTVNEAIEIARKYSTAESGKFVNGVLGSVIRSTPKAHWDPDQAPAEFEVPYSDDDAEAEIESLVQPVEDIDVKEDDEQFKVAAKFGGWKLVSGDKVIPPVTDH